MTTSNPAVDQLNKILDVLGRCQAQAISMQISVPVIGTPEEEVISKVGSDKVRVNQYYIF